MNGRSHKVIIVSICGAVILGGWQLLTTPAMSEFDNLASELVWQADDSSEESTGMAESVSAATREMVETATVRPEAASSENAGSFTSTSWLAIEPQAVAETVNTKIASPKTDSESTDETDLSPDFSIRSLPDSVDESENETEVQGEPKDLIQSNEPQALAFDSTFLAKANSHLPIVDRSSPFMMVPVQSQSALDQTEQSKTPVASSIVEQRALDHLEYGKSLARRGATFAAREEFVQSLRLIAESYDMQTQTRDYTHMLADGLRALDEADDFVLLNAEQHDIDMARIIATHESKVVSESMAKNLSPIKAMQMYFQYSTGKITAAAGRSTAAADVLHAMGKLLQTSSQSDATGKPMDRAKAMVMFQAALGANPSDYRSANELGVLLAQNGKWEMAKELFAKSLVITKSQESWLNLAKAHEQLGEQEFARQANMEYRRMAGQSKSSNSMEWVSAKQFEAEGLMSEAAIAPAVAKTARQEPVEPETRGNKIINGIKKWF